VPEVDESTDGSTERRFVDVLGEQLLDVLPAIAERHDRAASR
jgi:hypothetical protein